MIAALVTVMLFAAVLGVVNPCPTSCSCSTTTSGVSVNCDSRNIGHVPENIPHTTYHLNLENNGISVIEDGAFEWLSRLQKLYLNRNNISIIENGAFRGLESLQILHLLNNSLQSITENAFGNLKGLTHLNLALNEISIIEDGAFRGLDSLQYLYLYANRLLTIAKNTFVNLTSLNELYLSGNDLQYIAENTFINLPSLRWLYLSDNDLQSIAENTFVNLPSLERLDLRWNSIIHVENQVLNSLSGLQKLYLDGNPLMCNCSILYLWTWLTDHPSVYTDARCSNGTYVRSINSTDLDHCYINHHPREVIISPLIQSYTVNETDKFGPVSCTADCEPYCQIKWTGPNLAIGSKSVLNLQNISRNQAGEYYCTASNSIGSAKSVEINVIVDYGPREVFISSLMQSYIVNETANLGLVSCIADCKPDCLIKWNGPNLPISSTSVLNLQNISRYQTGNYYCTASNILGSARSIEITVIVNHAPYDITLSPTTMSYIVNETGSLVPITCTADCVPRCKIKWKGPNLPSNADYQLTLKNISRNQDGKYHCIATNDLGQIVSSTVLIVVYYPCENLILAKNENDETIFKAGISSLVIGIFMILITIVANCVLCRFRTTERKEDPRSNDCLMASASNPAFTGVYDNASQAVLNTDTVNTTSGIGASADKYVYEDLQENTKSKNDKRIYQTLQKSGKGDEDMTSSQYINMEF